MKENKRLGFEGFTDFDAFSLEGNFGLLDHYDGRL